MKQFILTFLGIVLAQFCYASETIDTDSTKAVYHICGNDTVFYKKFNTSGTSTWCGLKQYEEVVFEDSHKQCNKVDFEYLINKFNSDNKNKANFCKYIIRNFLEGYGKEQCAEFLETYDGLSLPVAIYICINIDGEIIDLKFIYKPHFANYMTCEDVVRNTKQFLNSGSAPSFAEYAELGIKILPPLSIPILRKNVEDYLKEEECN